VLPTYLGLQKPAAFDTVLIEPEPRYPADTAVIFLHGFMGNVTAQCWAIAQAASQMGAITACPSTEWTGGWWQPPGEAILEATFQYLREQGIKRFYLGGFSNGGFGISRLVSTVSAQAGLRGLFFINGIQGGAQIQQTGQPVLIVQGTQDTRVPAGMVRKIAQDLGTQATFVEVESDHFMIMKQPGLVQDVLTRWLQEQEMHK
jgi:pimeloyl-ACP methyl ester carboxylesterase